MNTQTCVGVYRRRVRHRITLSDIMCSKLFRQRIAGLVLILVGLFALKLDSNLYPLIGLSPYYLAALFSKSYIFYE